MPSGARHLQVAKRPLFILTLVLSFCSIVYELLLAQSMAATLGNTFLRYNVTIGLYLASLGGGALLCSRRKAGDLVLRLIEVEVALAFLGALSPLLILFWDAAMFKALPRPGYWLMAYGFDHGLVVLVGLFSGFELPLLMRLGGDKANEVLAVDYGGTLLGALLFPLCLLPGLGVLQAAALTGLLNALCALYLLLFVRQDSRRMIPCCAAAAVCLALLAMRGSLDRAAAAWYLLP